MLFFSVCFFLAAAGVLSHFGEVDLYPLEIPYRFVDRFHKGKRIVVLQQNIFKLNQLALIYYAHDNIFFCIAVRPDCPKTGCAVLEFRQ